MKTIRGYLLDHICKECNGRIMQVISGSGITGGGNPCFMCVDCGNAISAMSPSMICHCDDEFICGPWIEKYHHMVKPLTEKRLVTYYKYSEWIAYLKYEANLE